MGAPGAPSLAWQARKRVGGRSWLRCGRGAGGQPSSIGPATSCSQLSAPRGGAVWTIPFSLSPSAPVRFEQQYPQWGLQGGRVRSEAVPLTPSRWVPGGLWPCPLGVAAPPPAPSLLLGSSYLPARGPMGLSVESSPTSQAQGEGSKWRPLPARMSHPL